jgi:hypothetical protein
MLSMEEEFDTLNLKTKIKQRFIKTMKTLSHSPQKSIYMASNSRAEAKAVYRMLANDEFKINEVKETHKESTINRTIEAKTTILAVQDTTTLNYNTHKKTEGLGYCCDKTLGINVHSCLAVTDDGVVLGILDQSTITRPENKDPTPASQKRKRSIEEKESNRWLETMERSAAGIPPEIKVIHVCDREGDMYELFEKAHKTQQNFLIRVSHERQTNEAEKIINTIKKEEPAGCITVIIPRNSRDNIKERQAKLAISYRHFNVKKPKTLSQNEDLLPSVPLTIVYVKEITDSAKTESIEWVLGTNEEVNSFEDACKIVGYYRQRWKIERFHHVLKSGCSAEKIQERSVDRMVMLLFMYSVIATFIMNLTYIARNNPGLSCDVFFDDQEWKVLYCAANKTRDAPDEPYSISDAVKYLGWLGGPKQAPSDGPPGVKLVWTGWSNLQLLMAYREWV